MRKETIICDSCGYLFIWDEHPIELQLSYQYGVISKKEICANCLDKFNELLKTFWKKI